MNSFLTFIDGPLSGTVVQAEYESTLVVLSYVVAAYAAYTALDFAGRVRQSAANRGRALGWLLAGACAMGTGIWGMHFIAMLAWRVPLPVSYDISTTLASLAVAVILSGFALHVVSRRRLPVWRLLGGGVLMGLGVVTMHYTGMAAINMEALIAYRPGLFAVSVLNAIVCSTVALWLVFRIGATATSLRHSGLKVAAALFMGLAIAGMHYTAMYAGVCVSPQPVGTEIAPLDPRLSGVYFRRGLTYTKLGGAENYRKAIADYEAELRLLDSATVSPAEIWPTPAGVPVSTTSPGSRVNAAEA